jgi:hypothetical protein
MLHEDEYKLQILKFLGLQTRSFLRLWLRAQQTLLSQNQAGQRLRCEPFNYIAVLLLHIDTAGGRIDEV